MSRPVPATYVRAAAYRVLIELAGRRLLWPAGIVTGVLVIWLTWPLVAILFCIALALFLIAMVVFS